MPIDGVYIKNRKGPSTEPWGTPLQNFSGRQQGSLCEMLIWMLIVKMKLIWNERKEL